MSQNLGFLVTTVSGTPIYQGWASRHSELPVKQLSMAVANIFNQSPERESTFITTGPYSGKFVLPALREMIGVFLVSSFICDSLHEEPPVTFLLSLSPPVASVLDERTFIVSLVCSSSSSEPEMLMKAKELAHNIKLLLGVTQTLKLSARRPEDLEKMLSSASLLKVFLLCFEADEQERQMEEKRQQGASSSKGSFVIVVNKGALDGRSGPTSLALDWLREIDESSGRQRLDNFFVEKLSLRSPCEDGFIQLENVNGFVAAHLLDLCEPHGEVLLDHWTISEDLQGEMGEAVVAMLKDSSSSLWGLILNETRRVLNQDREDKPTTSQMSCTINLTSFEPGLHATVKMLFLDEYDPAFIVFYKTNGALKRPFHVTSDLSSVPSQVLQKLSVADRLLREKFPSTRIDLMSLIWPSMPDFSTNSRYKIPPSPPVLPSFRELPTASGPSSPAKAPPPPPTAPPPQSLRASKAADLPSTSSQLQRPPPSPSPSNQQPPSKSSASRLSVRNPLAMEEEENLDDYWADGCGGGVASRPSDLSSLRKGPKGGKKEKEARGLGGMISCLFSFGSKDKNGTVKPPPPPPSSSSMAGKRPSLQPSLVAEDGKRSPSSSSRRDSLSWLDRIVGGGGGAGGGRPSSFSGQHRKVSPLNPSAATTGNNPIQSPAAAQSIHPPSPPPPLAPPPPIASSLHHQAPPVSPAPHHDHQPTSVEEDQITNAPTLAIEPTEDEVQMWNLVGSDDEASPPGTTPLASHLSTTSRQPSYDHQHTNPWKVDSAASSSSGSQMVHQDRVTGGDRGTVEKNSDARGRLQVALAAHTDPSMVKKLGSAVMNKPLEVSGGTHTRHQEGSFTSMASRAGSKGGGALSRAGSIGGGGISGGGARGAVPGVSSPSVSAAVQAAATAAALFRDALSREEEEEERRKQQPATSSGLHLGEVLPPSSSPLPVRVAMRKRMSSSSGAKQAPHPHPHPHPGLPLTSPISPNFDPHPPTGTPPPSAYRSRLSLGPHFTPQHLNSPPQLLQTRGALGDMATPLPPNLRPNPRGIETFLTGSPRARRATLGPSGYQDNPNSHTYHPGHGYGGQAPSPQPPPFPSHGDMKKESYKPMTNQAADKGVRKGKGSSSRRREEGAEAAGPSLLDQFYQDTPAKFKSPLPQSRPPLPSSHVKVTSHNYNDDDTLLQTSYTNDQSLSHHHHHRGLGGGRYSLGPDPWHPQQQMWDNLQGQGGPVGSSRSTIRSQVSKYDTQLRREREMRDWVQSPFTPGANLGPGLGLAGGLGGGPGLGKMMQPLSAQRGVGVGVGAGGGDIGRPYAVWQLFNGAWYWLDDEMRVWHQAPGGPMAMQAPGGPMAMQAPGGPMAMQALHMASPSPRDSPRSVTRSEFMKRAGTRGREEDYDHDSSSLSDQWPKEKKERRRGGQSHRRTREEEAKEREAMIEAATINATATATAVAAVAAPVAAGVAIQVWQSLQQGFFVPNPASTPAVDVNALRLAMTSALQSSTPIKTKV